MTTPELLRQAGLRRTPARVAVLDVLCAQGRPLTQAQVSSFPGLSAVDRVTIYRTLTRLEQTGLVHQVQGLDGAWRYCAHGTDAARCPGGHPHFVCTDCGQMSCLLDQAIPWVRVPDGVQVEGKQLVVYGRCAACLRSGDATG